MSQRTFQVLDKLYEAALMPSHWPEALTSLAEVCGGAGVAVSRGRIPEPALASPSLNASTADYAATWWEHDIRAARLERAFKGTPLTDADIITPEERRRNPYYQEFLKPYGFGNFAAVVLNPLPGMSLTVFLEGPSPFNRQQLETFTLLTPHVSRALAATARLGLTETFSRDLVIACEHVPCGMIFLTPQGKVWFVNEQAERVLGDGLTIEQQAVTAATPADQRKLDHLIASVLPGSVRPDDSVFVSRPSGKSPLLVQGLPIEPRQQDSLERLGIGSGGGLLLIHDLAGGRPRSVAHDLQRMGLTPAQARVAELVGSGLSVKQAADQIGVVEGTARAQLKAVFARLGVNRQSELAILITKLGSLAPSVSAT
jgi:DNA-binding CsgD family transcriptional regulator